MNDVDLLKHADALDLIAADYLHGAGDATFEYKIPTERGHFILKMKNNREAVQARAAKLRRDARQRWTTEMFDDAERAMRPHPSVRPRYRFNAERYQQFLDDGEPENAAQYKQLFEEHADAQTNNARPARA